MKNLTGRECRKQQFRNLKKIAIVGHDFGWGSMSDIKFFCNYFILMRKGVYLW